MRIAGIVMATIGHSTTLTLAALGFVYAPERPVEVLIAVSILVSGLPGPVSMSTIQPKDAHFGDRPPRGRADSDDTRPCPRLTRVSVTRLLGVSLSVG
jgi:HupE / UreJ protein